MPLAWPARADHRKRGSTPRHGYAHRLPQGSSGLFSSIAPVCEWMEPELVPTLDSPALSRRSAHLLTFLFFEDAAQDFPRWVARDGIDIFYLAHVLVGGELAIGPGDQFIGVHFFITCTQDNKGFGNLSCLFVRFGDDGHVGYSGMFQQQGFELGRG